MKALMTAAAVLVLVLGCGSPKTQPPSPAPAAETTTPAEPMPDTTAAAPAVPALPVEPGGPLKDTLAADKLPENLFIAFSVKDYGTIKIRFATKDAPKNVTNVANLAIKGFYNGLTFHRIIPGFVVQGGDPQGDGTGGPGYTVQAEIKRKHLKGSMAMARTGDQINPERRSSGSQFYFCLEPLPQLDGQYTVIGDLVEGMDVLGKLGQVKTGAMDKPVQPVIMEQVTVTTQ